MQKFFLASFFLLFQILLIKTGNAQKIAVGAWHSLAICEDSTIKAWGDNSMGKLGDGTIVSKSLPVSVQGLSKIVSVSAGGNFSLALDAFGKVFAWGMNGYGQLGNGNNIDTDTNPPTQVLGLDSIRAISGGSYHALALRMDGTVWAWGYNSIGQLGNGSTTTQNSPIQVSTLSNIIAISAGAEFSLALKSDGTVWGWGTNYDGELGVGLGPQYYPIQIPAFANIKAISANGLSSFALDENGYVWSWGWNAYGQLGIGNTTTKWNPVKINGLLKIQKISSGGAFTYAQDSSGAMWSWGQNFRGQLLDSTLNDRYLPGKVKAIDNIREIQGKAHILILKSDGTLWSLGYNGNGQLGDGTSIEKSNPGMVQNLCYISPIPINYAHKIHGYLYDDVNTDCTGQITELKLSFPVFASPENLYGFSNDAGYYSLGLNDSVNYTIRAVIPKHLSSMVKNPCPINYSVYLDSSDPKDTTDFDFGFEANPCYQLRVDVSGNRKRRCFQNFTSVTYWNEGLIPANGVDVHVKFDQYEIPLSASSPYTIDPSDSSLIFNIGTLNSNQSGYINIVDSIACVEGIMGLTQCTKAWITPTNTCLDSATADAGWDKSSIKVAGSCVNDTVRFVIYNHGSGDMTTPSQYRIYSDNALMQTSSFQLNSGDSLVITIVSGGATIRLEADQNPGHPGYSKPRATVEGCGTNGGGAFSTGEVNNAPMDDEDVNVEIDCMEIRDSYDPNEKLVSPEGIDGSHRVLPNTPLDFVIHFQNTGTDTAYKIVVVDTLSQYLDLSTLEPGASSANYKLSISGEGRPVLKFTFDNINLVDSFTNEPMSHGFVKYKIAPFSSTPLGTQINNAAEIYFDYNFPIRTNTAFVTLGNYYVVGLNEVNNLNKNGLSVYPNPTSGSITISSSKENPVQKITLYSIDGKKVFEREENSKNSSITIDIQTLSSGIYFMECVSKNASEKVKVVKH
jgi:alpha-tubulin suppressor-like RCC1 family protein